jgi:pimeloyl-ACP methyl ester carboxylesterase
VSCGYLTVLEDRLKPDGRTIRIFVARIDPYAGAEAPDPMLVPGGDLAWTPISEFIAPMAPRTGRQVIIMDQRGIGRSEPNLKCPEVEEIRSSLAVPLGDPSMRPVFLDAVTACRNRLVAEEVDLSAYNLANSAADAEELRLALGIEEWNLITLGSASRISFEIIRRYPEHIRAVVFDSPDVPQMDLLSEGIIGTRYALAELAQACAEDAACGERFPDLQETLALELERLEAEPILLHASGFEVMIDGTALLGVIRSGLSIHDWIPRLPAAIYDLPYEDDGAVAASTVQNPIYSHGYIQPGDDRPNFNHGLFYSVFCHDELPFIDQEVLTQLAAGEAWYEEAYANSPYLEVCQRWGVQGDDDSQAGAAVTSDIPTLFLIGRFNPFSPRPVVEEAASTFSRSYIVEFPNLSYNVLPFDCPRMIRNAWINNPDSPPDTTCVDNLPPVRFVTD